MISIHSVASSRKLCIRRSGREYISIELLGHQTTATTEIWMYTDAPSLARFFGDLGKLDRPWVEEREWSSIEHDLAFKVSCTSLGAVTFDVTISGMDGAPERWQLQAGIETEFGQLARIGHEAMELLDEPAAP